MQWGAPPRPVKEVESCCRKQALFVGTAGTSSTSSCWGWLGFPVGLRSSPCGMQPLLGPLVLLLLLGWLGSALVQDAPGATGASPSSWSEPKAEGHFRCFSKVLLFLLIFPDFGSPVPKCNWNHGAGKPGIISQGTDKPCTVPRGCADLAAEGKGWENSSQPSAEVTHP